MNLVRKGNELSGSYYYHDKLKQPISIAGELKADGTLILEEKDEKGTINGVFEGSLAADSALIGQWHKPGSEKQLPFALKEATDAFTEVKVTEYSFSVQGKEGMTADFSFPKVQGISTPTVATKVNQLLSIQNLTDEEEEDIKKNFAQCTCGLVNSSFAVTYNQQAILSITVVNEWLGAYSSFSTKYINLNTATGEPIKIEQLLLASSLDELTAQANKLLQERITQTKKEAADAGEAEWADELLADKKFEKTDLKNFTIHEKGITFHYVFGFPHAALALEPDGAIEFTYQQLQQFINPNGLLAMEKK